MFTMARSVAIRQIKFLLIFSIMKKKEGRKNHKMY